MIHWIFTFCKKRWAPKKKLYLFFDPMTPYCLSDLFRYILWLQKYTKVAFEKLKSFLVYFYGEK